MFIDFEKFIATLRSAGSAQALRALAPLPKNAQEMIDDAVVRVGRQRLAFVDLLLRKNLTVSYPNWMAVPILTSHRLADAGRARTAMTPARGENRIMQWTPYSLPLYTTYDGFKLDLRQMLAAAAAGHPLDTLDVEMCTRNVNEALEDVALYGGVQFDALTVPGVTDSTITDTYAAWTGATGLVIKTAVLSMAAKLQAVSRYGPYALLVGTAYGNTLQRNWSDGVTTFPQSIADVLRQLTFANQNLEIVVCDMLAEDTVVLVQMTSDVIDLVVGQQPQPVPLTQIDPFSRDYLVLACIVPRVKVDSNGNYGICVGSKT